MTDTLFGLGINPIDNLQAVLPIRFVNLWDTSGLGRSIFSPIGVKTTGGVGCPDGTTDPVSTINYLHNKREVIEQTAYQRPLFRIANKDLDIIGEITQELSAEFEELMADSGTARYVVHWENWMVDYLVRLTQIAEDLHFIVDPIPSQPTWRTRWGGKIHTINIQRHEDGTSTVEILAISNREHFKKLLIAANPIFPCEFQQPRMWMLPGPTRSILFMTMMINLARLFVPGLSFITNLLNPLSWLDPLNVDSLHNINPFDWPIQCAFVNTAFDTSRWNVVGATWTSMHDATQDILKDAGVMARGYTFFTTDEDSPYDELVNLVDTLVDAGVGLIDSATGGLINLAGPAGKLEGKVANNIRPQRNCVIFRFEDKSGQTGPTGTAIDGLLNVIGVTLDDFLSSTLIDANTGLALDGEPVLDVNGNNFPIFEDLLGLVPETPKVIWREGQFTALIEANHTLHKGAPRTVMTGGKSPAIVNQIQDFAIKYALSQLSDMINVGIGTFANTAFQMPLSNGLDALYQNQLDNTFFAWQRVTNPSVALWGGDLDYQEFFERGSGTAYTLSGILTLRTAIWKTRPFQGFKAKVLPGRPWTIDVDTFLGDRNGFEFDHVICVDQLYGIKRGVENGKPFLPELTIGEDKEKADPMGRVIRAVSAVYSMVGAIFGEGTIFG